MKATITLCDHDDNRIEVEVDYYIERDLYYYVISECVILSPIPDGFVSSDLKTDIEESIREIEGKCVSLDCKVEYGLNHWQRIISINPECKLTSVA